MDVEGEVGTRLLYKLDKQLFRRYTRNASVAVVHTEEFADDVVLLAAWCRGCC